MIKPGSFVRMWNDQYNYYVYGEVTLMGAEGFAKVLWGADSDLNYDYYLIEKLEEIKEEDLKD